METLSNLSFLETFTGGNKEKMAKYINMFLQTCPEQLKKMNTYLSEHDYSGLRATAHSLKPQITYMGIKKGEELVKRIELLAGEQKDTDQIPTLLEEFNHTCSVAIEELKRAI